MVNYWWDVSWLEKEAWSGSCSATSTANQGIWLFAQLTNISAYSICLVWLACKVPLIQPEIIPICVDLLSRMLTWFFPPRLSVWFNFSWFLSHFWSDQFFLVTISIKTDPPSLFRCSARAELTRLNKRLLLCDFCIQGHLEGSPQPPLTNYNQRENSTPLSDSTTAKERTGGKRKPLAF